MARRTIMLRKISESFVMFRSQKIPVYIEPGPRVLKNEKGEVLTFDFRYTFTYLDNWKTEEFYFSDTHTIPRSLEDRDRHWVPVTATIPSTVTPREKLPTGFITCLEDYVKIFLYDRKFMGRV